MQGNECSCRTCTCLEVSSENSPLRFKAASAVAAKSIMLDLLLLLFPRMTRRVMWLWRRRRLSSIPAQIFAVSIPCHDAFLLFIILMYTNHLCWCLGTFQYVPTVLFQQWLGPNPNKFSTRSGSLSFRKAKPLEHEHLFFVLSYLKWSSLVQLFSFQGFLFSLIATVQSGS